VRFTPPALLALLAAVVLAGCSGQTSSNSADDFNGEQKAVAQVIDDLADAGSDGDAKEICDTLLSRELSSKLKQGNRDCQDIVDDQLSDANVFDLDVKSIQITGDTATAQVESKFDGEDAVRTLRLERDGQAWRLTGIEN
jgi:outer membrane PBP1 activator LpoA protein